MDSVNLEQKTKEELIDLVRLTRVLPISEARRMRKNELLNYLYQAENQQIDEQKAKPNFHLEQDQSMHSEMPFVRRGRGRPIKRPIFAASENMRREERREEQIPRWISEPVEELSNFPSWAASEIQEEPYYPSNPYENKVAEGILDVMPTGYGFLHVRNYSISSDDIYLSPLQIKRFHLRNGDRIEGLVGASQGNKNPRFEQIYRVNGKELQGHYRKPWFDRLTAVVPFEKWEIKFSQEEIQPNLLQKLHPLAKGQRVLLSVEPEADADSLLQLWAEQLDQEAPQAHKFFIFLTTRPEKQQLLRKRVQGEFLTVFTDKGAENIIRMVELALEQAKRRVEEGEDVLFFLDGLEYLHKAYKCLSRGEYGSNIGEREVQGIQNLHQVFSSGRALEEGGSLTLIATLHEGEESCVQELLPLANQTLYLKKAPTISGLPYRVDWLRSFTREPRALGSDEDWKIRCALFNKIASFPESSWDYSAEEKLFQLLAENDKI